MTTIQVEDLSDVRKRVTFEIPEEKVLEVMDSQYKDLKKNVQLKGFRKGKVPLPMLRAYFKTQVQADTAKKLIEETLEPALDERKLKPISVTNIDSEGLEEGKPFKFTAEIEIPPQLDVQGYKGLKLKRTVRTVTDQQVEDELARLRERHARLAPVQEDRGIIPGDHVLVDIKAEIDGEVSTPLTVTDYHLEMGRNFYLPDFDSHCVGMKPDETKELVLDLPADFPRKNIAGKTAKFQVLVKEAKEKILPEMDDDFAKDVGDFETLDALKAKIRSELETAGNRVSDKEIEMQIVDSLLKENTFEVPESMIDRGSDSFIEDSLQGLIAQGHDPRSLPMPSQAYREQIKPAVHRAIQKTLLFKGIAEKEGVEVTEEEITAEITKRAETLDVSPDFLKDRLEQDGRMEDLRESLVFDKVYKFVVDNAEITEEAPSSAEGSAEAEKA